MTGALLDQLEEARRVAYELGWDYAVHGLKLPDTITGSLLEAARQGYGEAQNRFACKRDSDRFIRKWLQIRHSALLRGRVVSSEVTPDFIRAIDAKVCPVLRVRLTHGTQLDTDWSVDRLNNDGAYAPGNLVVMSTRANKAKGAKTIEEVIAITENHVEFDGLKNVEWLRIACLMNRVCFESSRCLYMIPFVVEPLPFLPTNNFEALQDAVSLALVGEAPMAPFKRAGASAQSRKRWEKFVSTFNRVGSALVSMNYRPGSKGSYPTIFDTWSVESVFSKYKAWLASLDVHEMEKIVEYSVSMITKGEFPQAVIEGWCVDSKGYLDHHSVRAALNGDDDIRSFVDECQCLLNGARSKHEKRRAL